MSGWRSTSTDDKHLAGPENFPGPEDGRVPTFAVTGPNALPRGLARGPLKVRLGRKAAHFGVSLGVELLVFLLVSSMFASEIKLLNQGHRL